MKIILKFEKRADEIGMEHHFIRIQPKEPSANPGLFSKIIKAIDASDVMILSMIASCICSWCVYVFVASLIYMAINFWLCRRKLDKEVGNEETPLESNGNK